jgi:spermidine synthase
VKVSVWKRWWSYISEVKLEETYSELIDEVLTVSLVEGRLQLYTKLSIYSFEDLYVNFEKVLKKAHFNKKESYSVLLLGFGLGSIAQILEKYHPEVSFNFVAVELDAAVIYLAGKYGLPKIKSPIQMYNTDASDFIEINHEKYDLIAMDVFMDDKIPRYFHTKDFINKLNKKLFRYGVVLYNCLSYNKEDLKVSNKILSNFASIFAKYKKVKVEGNWILISDPGNLTID